MLTGLSSAFPFVPAMALVAFVITKIVRDRSNSRRRIAARVRAAETADVDALRRAIKILSDAASEIIRADIKQFGEHPSGCPRWTKVYNAKTAVEAQLNDVTSLALGERLR